MSSEAIRPSTLDGIKRLAKKLKSEHHIHARALDAAAQAAGFQNFRHASNVLRTAPKPGRPRPGHCLFLTAYWKEREGSASGRETLTISLSAPWQELITPLQLQSHRALVRFHSEGPDHLARGQLLHTQSGARRATVLLHVSCISWMRRNCVHPGAIVVPFPAVGRATLSPAMTITASGTTARRSGICLWTSHTRTPSKARL